MKRFRDDYTTAARREGAVAAMKLNPGLVPVFPEPATAAVYSGARLKFLCSREATLAKFVSCLRKRLTQLKPTDSITVMTVHGTMIPSTSKIGDVWDKHHDEEDLYLYLVFSVESTFG